MTPNLDRGELERQRDALLAQVRGLGNLMRGTVVEVGVKCGRAGCGCAGGEKHRKIHLAVNLQGRSHGCYLGQERAEVVAPLIAEYERAWGLINALTAVNLALVRGTHPGGRPGRKRKRRAA
jgi:transposase